MAITIRERRGEPERTLYAGLVVAEHESYAGDDRYARYATVWEPAVGRFRTFCYEGGYPEHLLSAATVDAPPEILAKWAESVALDTAERHARWMAMAAEKRLLTLERGRPVRVVRGRKVPIGTTGEIIWIGAGHWGTRVGLKDAAGTVHWTAATNVEIDVTGDEAADLYDLHLAWLVAHEAHEATVVRTTYPEGGVDWTPKTEPAALAA